MSGSSGSPGQSPATRFSERHDSSRSPGPPRSRSLRTPPSRRGRASAPETSSGLDAVLATFDGSRTLTPGSTPAPSRPNAPRPMNAACAPATSTSAATTRPRAALFGEGACIAAAGRLLDRYLGADCAVLGYRDASPAPGPWKAVRADDPRQGRGDPRQGASRTSSSVPRSSTASGPRPHSSPIAPPLRGRWRLAAVPFSGVEGALAMVEAVLNACTAERKADWAAAPWDGMDEGQQRAVRPGLRVAIVQKQDQRTGRTVEGVVAAVLTRSRPPPAWHQGPACRRPGRPGEGRARP